MKYFLFRWMTVVAALFFGTMLLPGGSLTVQSGDGWAVALPLGEGHAKAMPLLE